MAAQQITALTPSQRERYHRLNDEMERRIDAADSKLGENERMRIIAAMREDLAGPPRPVAKPRGEITQLNAEQRMRLVNAVPDYPEGKKTADTLRYGALLQQAHDTAAAKERMAREASLRPLRESTQQEKDSFFRSCEIERSRDALSNKVRTDFQKGAEGDGVAQGPIKSDAIARAIERVKAKEEEERARNEREQDRGRSLTDTFNKSC